MVRHLARHPLDNDVRERLATVYAEHFQRLDLAAQELETLIATPHQPQKLVAHWLNLLADFQVRATGGVEAARLTLQRIVDQFPRSAAAANAETRLGQLKLELKQHSVTRVIKLGHYEQNIGLKSGRP